MDGRNVNNNEKGSKKEIKIKVWVLLVVLVVLGALLVMTNGNQGQYYKITVGFTNMHKDENESSFYQLINNIATINNSIIKSYDEYEQILETANNCEKLKIKSKIKKEAFEKNNFVVVSISKVSFKEKTKILSVVENGNTVNIRIYVQDNPPVARSACDVYFIPVSKNITGVIEME